MILAGEGIDNAIKRGKLVSLKMIIEIAYMGINSNGKVCVVGVKRRIILMNNLC